MSELVNTGLERSLLLVVDQYINGVKQNSIKYDGRLSFGSWPEITSSQLARMSQDDFYARLAAFKAYVESIVPGLDIDAVTEAGRAAVRANSGSCPIGVISEEQDDDEQNTTAPDSSSSETGTGTTAPDGAKTPTTEPMSLEDVI